MNTVQRALTGAVLGAGVAGGLTALGNYELDPDANVHEVQACALLLAMDGVTASEVQTGCQNFDFTQADSLVVNGTIKVANATSFLEQKLAAAEKKDDDADKDRRQQLLLALGIGAVAGATIVVVAGATRNKSESED